MSAISALQSAINIKLRRTYTSAEIADVISALHDDGYVVAPAGQTSELMEPLEWLANFAEHASTLDWGEDRNISWAAIVAYKARAAIAKARGETP